MTDISVPVTWSALLKSNARYLDQDAEVLLDEIAFAGSSVQKSEGYAAAYPYCDALAGGAHILVQFLVTKGAEEVNRRFDPIWKSLEFALDEFLVSSASSASGSSARSVSVSSAIQVTPDSRFYAKELLAIINVGECCGIKLTDDISAKADVLRLRLADLITEMSLSKTQRDLVDDRERYQAVSDLLIASRPEEIAPVISQVETLLGVPIENIEQHPTSFSFDTLAFMRHLFSALIMQQDESVAIKALRSFIASFPHKLAAGTLDWNILPYAVRIVFCKIGNEPEGSVGIALRSFVEELAVTE